MNDHTSQVPEGTKIKDKCQWTTCNRLAFFEDWCGATWCPYHMYYTLRWSGGNIWYGFKNIKLHWPRTRIIKHYDATYTETN